MLENVFEILDGKLAQIKELTLKVQDDKNVLILDLDFHTTRCLLICENVSELNLKEFYLPIQITLSVVDNNTAGWDRLARYHLYDYEEGLIDYFCSDVHVVRMQ